MHRAVAQAVLFALLSGTTRLFVQDVETRVQIVAFCLIATIWECWMRPRLGYRASAKALFAAAVAITTSAVVAKLYMELIYIPGVLSRGG